jgi:hypothetical protein
VGTSSLGNREEEGRWVPGTHHHLSQGAESPGLKPGVTESSIVKICKSL